MWVIYVYLDSCVLSLKTSLTFKLNANRMIVGTLRGFDQFMNLVVDNTVEVNGNEKNDIGMVVIRGNSVVTVEALEPVVNRIG
ncbi:small nuclear ribonucleoprotein [Medicago truncatula]|uniref:Small nuclear ribonucleoprotein G n=1 Tax=Medicago truncatula TaxID=3880 RepID=A0A072UA59_MEDTR|nr:small nuclear ribonucleoprotein [Medicago truncatula]